MKWAIAAPPDSAWGSDLVAVLRDLLEHEVRLAESEDDLRGVDAVALSGDEAWCAALATEAMAAGTLGRGLADYARDGGLLLAIGAGFAAACALGLLPGELLRNEPEGFVCRMVGLRVQGIANPWAQRAVVGDLWRLPVRTACGRYRAEGAVLDQLERDGLVLLRYEENPTGSERDIAAVMNRRRNVLGITVHPENVVDASLVDPQWPGLDSGRILLESLAGWVEEGFHRGAVESSR